jgi:hypothetical protein
MYGAEESVVGWAEVLAALEERTVLLAWLWLWIAVPVDNLSGAVCIGTAVVQSPCV